MPKKYLYIEVSGKKIAIKASSLNSSGDIYHILAFLALLSKEGHELPKVKICYDREDASDDHDFAMQKNVNAGTQALRMMNFAEALNMASSFELLETDDKGSSQNSVRESATRDALPDYVLIDQRMTTVAVAKYFEEHDFKATSDAIRASFSQRNNTRVTKDDRTKLSSFKNYYQEYLAQIPKNKPVAVVHYRYSANANSEQTDLDFNLGAINFLKSKGYHVIVITADSRTKLPSNGTGPKIKQLQSEADNYYAPFNLDSPIGRSSKNAKSMEGSFPGFAKLYHLSLLNDLIEQSHNGLINLKGVLGTTSGTLDVASFIGHNVYNLHSFGTQNTISGITSTQIEYQDARILAQSSFMRIYENGDTLQNAIYYGIQSRYIVNFSDQYVPRTRPIKLSDQVTEGNFRYLTTTGKSLGEKEQYFAVDFLKRILSKDYKILQSRAASIEIPELAGYEVKRIEGDGNCMFNAVIAVLNSIDRSIIQRILQVDNVENIELVHILRNKIIKHIINKAALDQDYKEMLIQNAQVTLQQFHNINVADMTNEQIFQQYLELLQNDGVWGDHIALDAMANIFGVQIQVHSSHPTINIGNHGHIIHLHLHGEVHYDAYLEDTQNQVDQLMMIADDIFSYNVDNETASPALANNVMLGIASLIISADA